MQRLTRSSKRQQEARKKKTVQMQKSPRNNDEIHKETTDVIFDISMPSDHTDAAVPAVTPSSSSLQPNANTKRKDKKCSSGHKSVKTSEAKLCSKESNLEEGNKVYNSVSHSQSHFLETTRSRSFNASVVTVTDASDLNTDRVDNGLKNRIDKQIVTDSVSHVVIRTESSNRIKDANNKISDTTRSRMAKKLKASPVDHVTVSASTKNELVPSTYVHSLNEGISCNESFRPRLTRSRKGQLQNANVTISTDENITNLDMKSPYCTRSQSLNDQSKSVEFVGELTSYLSASLPSSNQKRDINKTMKSKRCTDVKCLSKEPTCCRKSKVVSMPPVNEICSSSAAAYSSSGESVVREFQPKSHIWPEKHDKSRNVFHYISNVALGRPSVENRKAVIEACTLSSLAQFEVTTGNQPFRCRVTAIDWHPRVDNFFCVGSMHGDLEFYKLGYEDYCVLKDLKTYTGIGPGGYISALKFHPVDNEVIYTASLDGKVCSRNFEKEWESVERVLLNTNSWEQWFCSLDVHQTDNLVVAGQNNGWTSFISRTGEMISKKRLHTSKISHLEFSPREPYLLCSASLDHTVRMWDIRMIVDKKPLNSLLHEKGLNSAYFSLTDGTRLLTTDQFDEIRVYRAPFWHLETCIKHPHRFSQHITPIKAYWHPLADYIICGRFPDGQNYPDFGKRTMDVYDASTGKMHFELNETPFNGIVSLCKFNKTGDKLLCSRGYNFYMWSHQTHLYDAVMSNRQEMESTCIRLFVRSQNYSSARSAQQDLRSRLKRKEENKLQNTASVQSKKRKSIAEAHHIKSGDKC